MKYPWDYKPEDDWTENEKKQWGDGGSNGGGSTNTTPNTSIPTTPSTDSSGSSPNPSGMVYPWDTVSTPTQTQVVQWGLNEPDNTSYSAAVYQKKITADTTPQEYYKTANIQTYPTVKERSGTTVNTLSVTPSVFTGLAPTQAQQQPQAQQTPTAQQTATFTRDGTMRALTEEEKKRQRGGFLSGFFGSSLVDNFASVIFQGRYTDAAMQASQARGGTYTMTTDPKQKKEEGAFLFGIASGYALDVGGGNVVGGNLGKAGDALKKLDNLIPKNIVTQTGKTIGLGIAGFEGGKEYFLTRTGVTKEERQAIKENKAAYEAGRQAEAASKDTLAGSVAYNVAPIAFGNEDAFYKGAEDYLVSQGKTDKEIAAALNALGKQRTGANVGNIAGQLTAGASSEYVGQQNVQKALSTGAKPTFKNLFMPIAKAGFGEGFVQPIIQQKTEGDTRPFFTGRRETNMFGVNVPLTRFEESAVAGVIGFGTAGVLGGAIGSTAAKGKKTTSKVLEYAGYAIDPFEKPSDIIEDLVVGGGTKVRVPAITPVSTGTPTQTQQQQKPSGFRVKTPVNIISGVPSTTPTNVPVKPNVPNMIFSDVPTPSDTPNKRRTVTDITKPIPTPIDTDIPIPSNTETPVETPVDTMTPTDIFTNVPVFTPINRLGAAPPLPMFDFGGGGRGGHGVKGRVGYVDELTAGRQMFNSFVGIPTVSKQRGRSASSKTTPPTKKKAPAKPKQQQQQKAGVGKRAGSILDKMMNRRF